MPRRKQPKAAKKIRKLPPRVTKKKSPPKKAPPKKSPPKKAPPKKAPPKKAPPKKAPPKKSPPKVPAPKVPPPIVPPPIVPPPIVPPPRAPSPLIDNSPKCRLCLEPLNFSSVLYSLYQPWPPSFPGMGMTISEDLALITNSTIAPTDDLPKIICSTCFTMLKIACEFVQFVQASDRILRKHANEQALGWRNISSWLDGWSNPRFNLT